MHAITPIFSIDNITHDAGAVTATIGINNNSEIFDGHFPGQPVVPGACILQLVKDVLEMALSCPLQLTKASQLKFISMIDPRTWQTAQLYIAYTKDEHIQAAARLVCGNTDSFKFQGVFKSNE